MSGINEDRRRLNTLMGAACATGLGLAPTLGAAQEPAGAYPSKPVRLIVPFPPGGGTDLASRMLARALEPVLGQSVVVDNRSGGGGNIGAQVAATAAPDGYSIFVGAIGPNVVNQYLHSNLPFDPQKDFVPITMVGRFHYIIVVPASSPLKTFQDLIKEAKRQPGALNYGIVAIGAPAHLCMEQLQRLADIKLTGVPYNGSPAAMRDLLGGRLDLMADAIGPQVGHLGSGAVRVLASTGPTRSRDLPNVPTIAESGFPGFSVIGWIGLFAPAGTPTPIVNKIFAATEKVLSTPEFTSSARKGEEFVKSASPKEFAQYLEAERKRWSKVIKDANIKLS